MLVTTQKIMGYIGQTHPMTREEMPVEVNLDKGQEVVVANTLDETANPPEFTEAQITRWRKGGLIKKATVQTVEKIVIDEDDDGSTPSVTKKPAATQPKPSNGRRGSRLKGKPEGEVDETLGNDNPDDEKSDTDTETDKTETE